MEPQNTIRRERFEVSGIVQGVGFRPFVYALATRLGLVGFVRNHSAGVTIEVEGREESLSQFARGLRADIPPLAAIDAIQITEIPAIGSLDFRILESAVITSESTPVAPDTAICDPCLAEMRDPCDRRYRYPFINCTHCGPRYTIVVDIPYDRPLTTMNDFPMCQACECEYLDPRNRRYHAQPNACPACGPQIWFVGESRKQLRTEFQQVGSCVGELAIHEFQRCISAEKIVAVKGIGGFHLACSASSSHAIRELRQRKSRMDKPLAVMVSDLAVAKQIAWIDAHEEQLLCSPARPIVLLRRRHDGDLSEWIAPGNDWIGLMLPYSPLHALLVERQPLVMTSGNLRDEPIARTNDEAFEKLSPLADAFFLHNREIHVVCDDSVVRSTDHGEMPIRRSRGYAPLPIRLSNTVPCVLATGGELKATFCLTKHDSAFLGPHIGDLENLETLAAYHRGVDHFQKLFRIQPEIIACDLHPDYLSSRWAREHAESHGLKLVKVQHHHAHLASVLAEHRRDRNERVIGIAFDGTGYGPEGTIWGGEVLLASCSDFQRWAHLKSVRLPGGDASVKHPYRTALAHLYAAGIPWDGRLPCVAACSPTEIGILQKQLERNLHCFSTSSMGRLFDAVAALLGVRQSVTYEAQAVIEMESLSGDHGDESAFYPFPISASPPHEIDPTPLLLEIVQDVMGKVPIGKIIGKFHLSVAQMIVAVCRLARARESIQVVALSGGVFQNQILSRITIELLRRNDFEVLTNRLVPCNDAGLALGQALVAATQVMKQSV